MDGLYDVVVIGGGPAGLTAALYLARAQCRVLVLEKEYFGGQIAITEEVVNYPGIMKTGGRELTETMRRQAEAFGAVFLLAEATALELSGEIKTVLTNRGNFQCFGVLLASGAHPRAVGFQGEEEYKGRGIAYCATCDGAFFAGKDVFVIGGGYAAAEESVFLTRYARHVTILIRKDDFSCPASIAAKARAQEKITVLTNTVVEQVSGQQGLNYIRWKNTETGETTEYRAEEGDFFGVFVLAGYAPNTALVKNIAKCNDQGYVITDSNQKTNVDGLYAAGDVCMKSLRQVVTATGDGALAAAALEKYVTDARKKTGQDRRPERAPAGREVQKKHDPEELLDEGDRRQLEQVFSRMKQPMLLKLVLDDRPVSNELERLMTELTMQTDRLSVTVEQKHSENPEAPYVSVCLADGRETGLAFHGAPGGHEFSSFVLGLYHGAGSGQPLDPQIRERIAAISGPIHMKLLVTLSCTMCPELVAAAQRIAAENTDITAHVYDIAHFEALRQQYQVMSVPCLVINDQQVFFGRKNLEQLLALIEQ